MCVPMCVGVGVCMSVDVCVDPENNLRCHYSGMSHLSPPSEVHGSVTCFSCHLTQNRGTCRYTEHCIGAGNLEYNAR